MSETEKNKRPRKISEDKKSSAEAMGTSEKPQESPKGETKDSRNAVRKFFADDRVIRISGLLFLLFSAVFVLAGVSYLFTWRADYDLVNEISPSWLSGNAPVTGNWLGKIGAILSQWLLAKGFGMPGLLLSLVTTGIGLNLLLRKQVVGVVALFFKVIPWMVSLSFVAGYFFGDSYFFLGGVFGCQMAALSISWWGHAGTLLLMAALLGVAGILYAASLKKMIPFSLFRTNQNKTEEELHEQENVQEETMVAEIPSETMEEEGTVEFKLRNPGGPSLYRTEKSVKAENAVKTPKEIALEVKAPEPENTPLPEITAVALEIEAPEIAKDAEGHQDYETEKLVAVKMADQLVDYDPKLDLSSYKYPPLDLLEIRGSDTITVNNDELNSNKDRIIETLRNYGIEIDKIKATIGPTVTLYEIVPAPGIRISRIKNLEDDIALSLAALGIRIMAPIPGKGTIGIEVPNLKPELVSMRSILSSEKFQNTEFDLPVALGKTISNDIFIADLAKMPHLLMAGATGQGKSVGINAILVSLLYKKHPSQMKLVLVDPKKVELTLFNIIEKHFLAKLPDSGEPIITDTKKVIYTLNSLCIEMDNRYELLKDAQVRNLKEYNAKFISRRLNPNHGHRYLPYIVLVIDEFADLIMTAGKEVEMPIARLAQLARAIGIHLVIATQRPSVNIITGTIKANFPARIAFKVSAKIDSRTILDAGGAERLIGRGDMLLSNGNDLVRIQCAFVDTPEVEKIAEHIGKQQSYPHAYELPEFTGEDAGEKKEEVDLSSTDSYFVEAARIIVQHQQGSTSLLQRRLKLGYNRAGRIVDQLEAAGIVGPNEGSKARQVMFQTEQALDEYLREKNFI